MINKQLLLLAIAGELSYTLQDDELDQWLNRLTSREKFVIEQRFANEPMALKAIAKICPRKIPTSDGSMTGCVLERVRQIENKALRKLRYFSRVRARN